MLNDESTAGTRLACPKCHASMRSYERNGVTIDRCTECGGLFLDRGELERLIDAEAVHYNPRRGDARGGYRDDDRRDWRDDDRGRYQDDRRRYRDDDDDDRGPRGFLESLFDFD